jgi:hypothetical protein
MRDKFHPSFTISILHIPRPRSVWGSHLIVPCGLGRAGVLALQILAVAGAYYLGAWWGCG